MSDQAKVNVRFDGPDWSGPVGGIDQPEGWDIVVDSYDFDYGVITVDPDHDVGCNETLAVRAGMVNEEGVAIGQVGWRIDPSERLRQRMPDVDFPDGAVFGRIIVTAAR
jgi:hypothetical protein